MKRVLVLIKGLGKGGAEQLLVNGAPYLDTSRFDYEFAYILPWKDAFAEDLRANGFTVRCLGDGRGPGWVGELRKLVKKQKIDLIHAHLPYTGVGSRLAVSLGRRPRLVYTEHNVWGSYRRPTYWGNLLTFRRNDFVFAVSESVRTSMRYPFPLRFLGMPRIETVYHGPDRATIPTWSHSDGIRRELGIPENALVVGTVANFKPKKGYRFLVEAAVEVRRVVPDVRFVLVGHGPDEPMIRQQARDLGLDRTIVFAGYRDDAPRVTATFDVFALPSLFEGLSIALVEAMALGKASVVTEAGGIPEVIEDGKHGIVVPIGRPREFAHALITLLQDADLRHRMGEAAQRRAADFDIRNAVRRVEDVYEELLA
jgi:glycosyltransferase involved in cell wall biosynthesis